jgi:4-hydroxy-4-methyl-2-oxoglutarate aldolase
MDQRGGLPTLDARLIAELAAYDTPTLANAFEILGIRSSPPPGRDIKPFTSIQKPLVGLAVTGTFSEQRGGKWEHLEGWLRFLEAIEATYVPAVAVLHDASNVPEREAMIGEGMVRAMRAVGAVGAICDGVNRDIKALRKIGFPTFCKGLSADRGRIRFHHYQVPVQLGELTVHPGDLLHADENGILVLPSDRVPEILQAAEQVSAKEAKLFPVFDEPGFCVARLREFYRDALESASTVCSELREHG